MKQIISGKLANTPELKEIKLEDGTKQVVTNFTVFAYDSNAPLVTRDDGSTYRKGIPLRCTAWGTNAEEVAKLKKGDQLTASSTLRYNEYPRKDGSMAVDTNYVIKRIDPENDIHRQLSNLLAGYEAHEYDQISEREIAPPDFQPDRDLNKQGKELNHEKEQEPELQEE